MTTRLSCNSTEPHPFLSGEKKTLPWSHRPCCSGGNSQRRWSLKRYPYRGIPSGISPWSSVTLYSAEGSSPAQKNNVHCFPCRLLHVIPRETPTLDYPRRKPLWTFTRWLLTRPITSWMCLGRFRPLQILLFSPTISLARSLLLWAPSSTGQPPGDSRIEHIVHHVNNSMLVNNSQPLHSENPVKRPVWVDGHQKVCPLWEEASALWHFSAQLSSRELCFSWGTLDATVYGVDGVGSSN